MTDETFRPIILCQVDLEDAWRTLMEPLGFSGRSLWLMFIDGDDRPLPQITEVQDLPPVLTDADCTGLERLLTHVADSGIRPAFLLSRPGSGGITDDDRCVAGQVMTACRSAGMAAEVMHLATDTMLLPVPMDELPLPASA
jgi:hypothetical protein